MSDDKRPRWAQAIAPAAAPRKFPATEVKRDHSAGYRGKYASRPESVESKRDRR